MCFVYIFSGEDILAVVKSNHCQNVSYSSQLLSCFVPKSTFKFHIRFCFSRHNFGKDGNTLLMELKHHKKACRAVRFSADGLCTFLQICMNRPLTFV